MTHTPPLLPDELSAAYTAFGQAQALELGMPAMARPLYEQALVGFVRHLGAAHTDTETCLSRLVGLLGDSLRENQLAPHESSMESGTIFHSAMGSLAAYNDDQIKAMDYFQCLHLIQSGQMEAGTTHLERIVQRLLAERAIALSAEAQEALGRAAALEREADDLLSDPVGARVLLEQALALREQVHGQHYMEHIPLLRKQIAVARAQDELGRVRPLLQRIADIHVELLGESHVASVQALSELMFAQWQQGGVGSDPGTQEQLLRGMGSAGGPELGGRFANMLGGLLSGLGALVPQLPAAPRRRRTRDPHPPADPPVLAGLDQIPWETLEHAYGSAGDLPDLLRQVLSDNEEIRSNAGGQLAELLSGGDVLHTATAAAVPFLLRMLAAPDTPDRAAILGYLASLALVTSLEEREERREEIDRNTRAALLDGVPLLVELCADSAALRADAVVMLGWLPERRAESAAPLQALLAEADDPALRAALLLALADLLERDGAAQQLFAEQLGHANHAAVAFAAAAALIDRADEHAPDKAVTVVLQTVAGLSAAAPRLPSQADMTGLFEQGGLAGAIGTISGLLFRRQSYWGDLELRGLFWSEDGLPAALAALVKLGPHGLPLLARLLPELPSVDHVARLLLDRAFGAPAEQQVARSIHSDGDQERLIPAAPIQPALDALSDTQREVLRVLLETPQLWALEPDRNPLRDFGLPPHRELLRLLVAGEPLATPKTSSSVAPVLFVDTEIPPAPDHAERVGRARQVWRQLRPQVRAAIIAYLNGEIGLKQVWLETEALEGIGWSREEAVELLSAGPGLDLLDLRLLELFLSRGLAFLLIGRLAREVRVAVAVAHLERIYREHRDVLLMESPLEAVAAVRGGYLEGGRPTPLGQLILDRMPDVAPKLLRLRAIRWGRGSGNAQELIDLLLAADPPYRAEALVLARSSDN